MGWTTDAEVVDVYDGDTVEVRVERAFRVRLLDCWAPEIRTRDDAEKALGFASRDHLRGLIPVGSRVRLYISAGDDPLAFDDSTSLSRVLGRIWADGKDVSVEQVAAGHATVSK